MLLTVKTKNKKNGIYMMTIRLPSCLKNVKRRRLLTLIVTCSSIDGRRKESLRRIKIDLIIFL